MASKEPWNRVNIPLPSAVSSVRIPFRSTTDAKTRTLLLENEKVLQLIGSELLQTEVRLLYELLHILSNSFRGNKTFSGLKQVEQCVNRLKNMKLDVALEELADLCPNRIQRGVSIKTGECDVPSQPTLEWLCLKVLGAGQLMSCTLDRCSRAFILSKQQMKSGEFLILNLVITSMLSRLWVIFRGVLVSLSTLYQELLDFRREVAQAQPMPFLTDFSLPADFAQLLGPSTACSLLKKLKPISCAKDHKETQQQRKTFAKVKTQGRIRKVKEDLGVALVRDIFQDTAMEPFLAVNKNFPKETHRANEKPRFKKQVREATSFSDMATRLEDMITWCKSRRMKKEKRLLTFLQLKCKKMICLEAAGYNVERKLKSFRQEASWASSPQGPAPRTCRFSSVLRRNTRRRKRIQPLRSRLRFSTVGTGKKRKTGLKKRQKRSKISTSGLSEDTLKPWTTPKVTSQTTPLGNNDAIDDIFASIGF
ncbi:nucleolus and neural progenitor protein isoform X2 [Solea solea]|uniref:nucleolus and neural progenitor protein isoform X2 n=1 Tax=Solea solea TaxID=90069 RepID=UPI00272AEDFC|nr:nucleolus and neural progenitor protein isoform X2 [Solea solea]